MRVAAQYQRELGGWGYGCFRPCYCCPDQWHYIENQSSQFAEVNRQGEVIHLEVSAPQLHDGDCAMSSRLKTTIAAMGLCGLMATASGCHSWELEVYGTPRIEIGYHVVHHLGPLIHSRLHRIHRHGPMKHLGKHMDRHLPVHHARRPGLCCGD